MNRITRREYAVLLVGVVIFIGLLIPSLLHARREVRDSIRRQEIAAFKNVLEHYYNQQETYPLEFDASPHRYVVTGSDSTGATSWYLQAILENAAVSHEGRNEEEGATFDYRVRRDGAITYYEVCGGTPFCRLATDTSEPAAQRLVP